VGRMTIAFICSFLYYQFKYRHLKILKATSRKWITQRKGDVVTYRIQILAKKNSEELQFDELWIDNKLFKVKVFKEEDKAIARFFSEKEKLYLEAERETGKAEYEEMAPSVKGKVALGYTVNNKRKYLSIKGFEEHAPKLSIAPPISK
jgi:hypothetical protein